MALIWFDDSSNICTKFSSYIITCLNHLCWGIYAFVCQQTYRIQYMWLEIPYSGKFWQGETLVNAPFLSIWRKKVRLMNSSANRLSIVTTNLDGFSLANHWRIGDDSPNSPNFLPAKLSHYTVIKQFLHQLNTHYTTNHTT